MAVIHIIRSDRENNMGVLRRFRQKVNEWGGLRKVREERYHKRDLSKFIVKKNRLRALAKKAIRTRLYKLGHIDHI
jgi:ribosomal protein S21